jgi:hypothetical protein
MFVAGPDDRVKLSLWGAVSKSCVRKAAELNGKVGAAAEPGAPDCAGSSARVQLTPFWGAGRAGRPNARPSAPWHKTEGREHKSASQNIRALRSQGTRDKPPSRNRMMAARRATFYRGAPDRPSPAPRDHDDDARGLCDCAPAGLPASAGIGPRGRVHAAPRSGRSRAISQDIVPKRGARGSPDGGSYRRTRPLYSCVQPKLTGHPGNTV